MQESIFFLLQTYDHSEDSHKSQFQPCLPCYVCNPTELHAVAYRSALQIAYRYTSGWKLYSQYVCVCLCMCVWIGLPYKHRTSDKIFIEVTLPFEMSVLPYVETTMGTLLFKIVLMKILSSIMHPVFNSFGPLICRSCYKQYIRCSLY